MLYTPPMFRDRAMAGAALARKLAPYGRLHPLVLGIPRGGVPVAQVVAERLNGELDVVLAHKLGAPWQAELSVGAIDAQGRVYLADYARSAGATEPYLEHEKARQLAMLQQRCGRYAAARPPSNAAGRCAIVIDDGLATGATMISALIALRAQHPAELIAAVPVSAAESLASVAPYADRIVCVECPVDFYAVGQFYAEFDAVSDDEVVAILLQAQTRQAALIKER